MPKRKPAIGWFFRHKDRIYKIVNVSQGTDVVVIRDFNTGELFEVRFALFTHGYKQVWKIGEVAKLLGRHPRSIYRYEEWGLINKPFCYPQRDGKQVRFYSREDILDIHEMISQLHQGRPRKDKRITNNTLDERSSLLIYMKERFDL